MLDIRSPRLALAVTAAAAAAAVVAGGAALSPVHAAPRAAGAQSAATSGSVRLSGEVVHGLAGATDLGAVPANAPIRLAVGLATDTPAEDASYAALFTPGSARYHDFYTPASFRAAFGADPQVAARVERAVTADGLQVVYAAPDGSYLELTGTTGQAERTFAVTEHTYRGLGLGTFTANAQAPTVPAGVAGVVGLSSLSVLHTAQLTRPAQDLCEPAAGTAGGLTAGPAGACLGTTTPPDLWSVYDQPGGATPGQRGAGGKIAIFGEGMVADVVSDLRLFEKDEHLPTVPVRQVLVGDNLVDDSGSVEWDLDSDASTGMSPDAQQLDYYFGSDLSDASIGGTYSAWVNDPDGPATGNSSFGGSEQLEYLGGFLEDTLLKQAVMEGRTMFSSAGDVGGSCLPGANGVTNTGVPCVEFPASSPYVVGVGGTVLYTATTDATGSTQATPAARADEYSWNYSGGGQSDFEPAPSWQVKAFPGGVGVPCAVVNTGDTCRGVPDVSAQSGDIATNNYVIVSKGALTSEGGTSLSSPLWAGMWNRVVADHPASCAAAASHPHWATSLGFAQEDLYNLGNDTAADPRDFFDVGGLTDSMPSSNGQQATLPRSVVDPTGYDYVSGLGSPILTGITDDLDCGRTTPVTPTVPVSNNDVVFNYDLTDGCPANATVTDPTGDEIPAIPVNQALDITALHVANTATAVTFTATVDDLGANPGDLNFAFLFKYGTGGYVVSADRGVASNTFSLYSLAITSTPIGLGVAVTPTDLSDALTGTVSGDTVTATLPLSVFNSAAAPASPLALGRSLSAVTLYTNDGPATTAIDNDYNVDPVDQAEFFQCLYTLTAPAAATASGGTGAAGSSGGSGSSGSSGGSGGSGGSSSSAGATGTHELAFTGLSAEAPPAALVLAGAGLALRRRRRSHQD